MNHTEIRNLNNMLPELSFEEHAMHVKNHKLRKEICMMFNSQYLLVFMTNFYTVTTPSHTITHASTFMKMWCAHVDIKFSTMELKHNDA